MRGAIAFALIVALGGCSREAPEPTVGPGNVCGDPALFGEIIGTVESAGACGLLRIIPAVRATTNRVRACLNTALAMLSISRVSG
jgi:hypothetical protein